MSVLPVGCLCGTPHGALRLVCFLWLIPTNSYPHHEQETYNRHSLLRQAKLPATVRAGTCLQLKNANDQDQQVLFTRVTQRQGTGFLVVLFCVDRAILYDTNLKMWMGCTNVFIFRRRTLVSDRRQLLFLTFLLLFFVFCLFCLPLTFK